MGSKREEEEDIREQEEKCKKEKKIKNKKEWSKKHMNRRSECSAGYINQILTPCRKQLFLAWM
jgi:hypothetical protein